MIHMMYYARLLWPSMSPKRNRWCRINNIIEHTRFVYSCVFPTRWNQATQLWKLESRTSNALVWPRGRSIPAMSRWSRNACPRRSRRASEKASVCHVWNCQHIIPTIQMELTREHNYTRSFLQGYMQLFWVYDYRTADTVSYPTWCDDLC